MGVQTAGSGQAPATMAWCTHASRGVEASSDAGTKPRLRACMAICERSPSADLLGSSRRSRSRSLPVRSVALTCTAGRMHKHHSPWLLTIKRRSTYTRLLVVVSRSTNQGVRVRSIKTRVPWRHASACMRYDAERMADLHAAGPAEGQQFAAATLPPAKLPLVHIHLQNTAWRRS